MYRYKLPIVIIIVNNGGIYGGFDAETYQDIRSSGDLSQMYVSIHNIVIVVEFFIFIKCFCLFFVCQNTTDCIDR